MILQVDSAMNSHMDEEPRAFYLGASRVHVLEIIDRWPAINYSYFKVHADDAGTYILRHDHRTEQWEMTLFKSSAL